jgi:hypothetical protein
MPVIELRELRETFGHDTRAINKHSVRSYECGGVFFNLDRTLDGVPPFFTLTRLKHNPREFNAVPPCGYYFPRVVQVEGAEHWGGGLSWRRAEMLAFEAMQNNI